MQRMQTAPAGTYSGMLSCAGGILKNEGPLAFYKVRLVTLVTLCIIISMKTESGGFEL